jgi:hypothetical protein
MWPSSVGFIDKLPGERSSSPSRAKAATAAGFTPLE